MSIVESNKLDVVASRPDSSIVRLYITDPLEWDDLEVHAHLLQEKINSYLDFIESGQLDKLEAPPIPNNPDIRITLAVQYRPSPEAQVLLEQIRDALERAGFCFEVEIRPMQIES